MAKTSLMSSCSILLISDIKTSKNHIYKVTGALAKQIPKSKNKEAELLFFLLARTVTEH